MKHPDRTETTVVIPLFNQLHYTKICLDSIAANGAGGARILLIDNASSDGTGEYLACCQGVDVISNQENLGCSGAWNQGMKESSSEWTVFLNNDVILSPGWLEGLLAFARQERCDVVSPAIREGEYNYDIIPYSKEFVATMAGVSRIGAAEGICFMVHRRVFDAIGGFDENFRIGQFEDTDFFRRAVLAGFRLGTTGRSFLHHFGSVTQKAIKKQKGVKPYVAQNRAYFHKKWRLSWWRRLFERKLRNWRDLLWRTREKARYGHSLREKWLDGSLRYF